MSLSITAPRRRVNNPYQPQVLSQPHEATQPQNRSGGNGSDVNHRRLFQNNSSQVTESISHVIPPGIRHDQYQCTFYPHSVVLPSTVEPPSYADTLLALHYAVFGVDLLPILLQFMHETHNNIPSIPEHAQSRFNRRFDEFKRVQPQYANLSIDNWIKYYSDFLSFIGAKHLQKQPLYQQITEYITFLQSINLRFVDITDTAETTGVTEDHIENSGNKSESDIDPEEPNLADDGSESDIDPEQAPAAAELVSNASTNSQQGLHKAYDPSSAPRHKAPQPAPKPSKKKPSRGNTNQTAKESQSNLVTLSEREKKQRLRSPKESVITDIREKDGKFEIYYKKVAKEKIEDTTTKSLQGDSITVKRGVTTYTVYKRGPGNSIPAKPANHLTKVTSLSSLQTPQTSVLKSVFRNIYEPVGFTIKLAYAFISIFFLKISQLIGISEIISLGYIAHADYRRIASNPSQFVPKDLEIKIEGLTKVGKSKYTTVKGYVYIGETQIINGIELPKKGKFISHFWEYDGEWSSAGKAHGQGHITWYDRRWPLLSSKKKKIIRSYFTGTFKNGNLYSGDMLCTDKTVFKGSFIDNAPGTGCVVFHGCRLSGGQGADIRIHFGEKQKHTHTTS